MTLYHFLNENYGLSAIRDRRIKIARISALNDPFEYLHLNTSNYVAQKLLKERKRTANQTFGLICFSKDFSDPVQWAHYSDSHRGICLGFDVESPELLEVEYLHSRTDANQFLGLLDLSDRDFVRYMLSKKHSHWSYEKEVRMIVSIPPKATELVFEPFSENLQLAEIIVGCRSRLSFASIKRMIREISPRPSVSKVVASDTDFVMEKVGQLGG